jgi:multidrug resistance efflux pump
MRTTWKLAIAPLVAAAAACGQTATADTAPAARPRGTIAGVGTVESVSGRVTLSFDQPGRVTEVLVREGARVEAGQLLARLDDRVARARVARAEAALTAARARADLAMRGARSDEIKVARSELEAARAQALGRVRIHDRDVRLLEEKVTSAAASDDTRTAAEVARAQVEAAQARLGLILRGTRSELRSAAAAEVEGAAAELEEARALLAQTELRAPVAAMVVRRYVEPGEQAVMLPPTPVLALADTDRVRIRTEIDEANVGRVAVGQRGVATAHGLGTRRVSGVVAAVEHELGRKRIVTDDPRARVDTRVLEVIFVADEPHDPLPLGLRMDVEVEVAPPSGG